jgi:hypothetical protein
MGCTIAVMCRHWAMGNSYECLRRRAARTSMKVKAPNASTVTSTEIHSPQSVPRAGVDATVLFGVAVPFCVS